MAYSQTDKYSEEEISVAHIFIEANKEKLVGNYEKAIELYQEVYKKDRNNASVCYELARTFDQIGEKERALEFSERSIKFDPDNEWFLIFNAETLEKSAKHKEAAERYRSMIKKDPENKYYYIKWAFNELENGDAEEAIFAFNELEKKQGVSEDITHRKFNIYVSQKNNKAAIKELLALSASDPTNTRYLNNLAGFYMNIGNKREANKVFKKILKIDPNDPSANIAVAGNSNSTGKEVSYLKAIDPILKDPQVELDMKIKELIPFVEMVGNANNNVTPELIRICKELLDIHPNSAKIHAMYGDVLFNAGSLEDAEKQYLKTIGLNKKVFAVWEQLMYTQVELENYQGLMEVSSNAIDIYPNQASAYYFNALAYFKNDNTKEAKDLLNESIMISGKNNTLKGMAYLLFSEIDYTQKDFALAEKHAQKAFDLGGHKNPKLLEILGDIYYQKDAIDKAVEYWQKAQEAGSKSGKLNLKIEQRQIIE